MSKVYVVYQFYNNGESYEDNYIETKVLKVFDSKLKALNFIDNYCPEGYMTKQEATIQSKEKWEEVKKYPSAEDYYENARGYMNEAYRYIKDVENKPDGSKTLLCHDGPYCAEPSFRIYLEAWEVE